MKAIVVTNQAAGTAGMKLMERTEPQAAINDVVVQVQASGFVPTELTRPSPGSSQSAAPSRRESRSSTITSSQCRWRSRSS